jgi:hypothetical protein
MFFELFTPAAVSTLEAAYSFDGVTTDSTITVRHLTGGSGSYSIDRFGIAGASLDFTVNDIAERIIASAAYSLDPGGASNADFSARVLVLFERIARQSFCVHIR